MSIINPVIRSLFDPSPRCARFIVTIYGDIVEPRGGVLWMGNLIDLCAIAGLNESLVRTSVSRLVSAGQLIGERDGRKSYYCLAPETRSEYREMAQRIYHSKVPPTDWMIIARRDVETDEYLKSRKFAVMNRNLLFGPKTTETYPDALIFEANVVHDQNRLPDFVSTFWNIEEIATNYHAFVQKFAALDEMIIENLTALDCLMARLALVHDYRHALAEDPDLPRNALPGDWPADEARSLFARLYLRLSVIADSYIPSNLTGEAGALARSTELSDRRKASLEKIIDCKNN